jgi:carbamoyl-phosphate synthase large subunit
VVTKIPRFTFEKFPQADSRLTTQMKSVGEVMSIGRTFQESLQKALRGLETGLTGLDPVKGSVEGYDDDRLRYEIRQPGPERILHLADAFRHDFGFETIHELTGIDPWFLAQVEDLVEQEKMLSGQNLQQLDHRAMLALKRKGFSDARLAKLLDSSEAEVRTHRHQFIKALNRMDEMKKIITPVSDIGLSPKVFPCIN